MKPEVGQRWRLKSNYNHYIAEVIKLTHSVRIEIIQVFISNDESRIYVGANFMSEYLQLDGPTDERWSLLSGQDKVKEEN